MAFFRVSVAPTLQSLAAAACLLPVNSFAVGNPPAAGNPAAAGEDALTALLRHQTDVGSEAGQRGDQETVNSFLDDLVLFSGGDGSVSRDPKFDSSGAVSKLLERQTISFLEAGQRGDVAAMQRMLDPKIVFINEDGDACGFSDFAGGAPAAPPKGIPSSVGISDWVLHTQGDVAVSSFVVNQLVHYDGQPLEYKFLTVDTWVQRGTSWKLLGGETIPLHQEPSAVTLPSETLAEYAGTYSAGLGSSVVVSVDQGTITLATNGAKATPVKAEYRDVFFRTGLPPGYAPPRVIFQRDATGAISAYVNGGVVYRKSPGIALVAPLAASPPPAAPSAPTPPSTPPQGPLKLRDFVVHHSGDVAVAAFFHDRDTPYYGQVLHQTYRSMEAWVKRGNEWKMIASQGRGLQKDPPAATLAPHELTEYLGRYVVGKSLAVTVAQDGEGLAMSINEGKPMALRATVRDVFFTPGAPRTIIIFLRNSSGRVEGYVSRRDERDLKFTKQ